MITRNILVFTYKVNRTIYRLTRRAVGGTHVAYLRQSCSHGSLQRPVHVPIYVRGIFPT